MKTKLICTLGPSSMNADVIHQMKSRGVSLFRINMSHTKISDLEDILTKLSKYDINICIDTEGCQVRTGFLGTNSLILKEKSSVKIYGNSITCNENNIYIRPKDALNELKDGDILSIDFNSVMLKAVDASTYSSQGYVNCEVIIGGPIGNNKGIAIIDKKIELPNFSKKDKKAIELSKKFKIKSFTLSFINNAAAVREFKSMYNANSDIYAKIETREGIQNFEEIIDQCDGILIDRGDLSREVQIEKIPLVQKMLINFSLEKKKECFVATNILESMCEEKKPNRAEVNDVINILADGATGLVLTKETAVGNNPIETVNMASSLALHYENIIKKLNNRSLIEFISKPLNEIDYINKENSSELLVIPHGGSLVNRKMNTYDYTKINSYKKVKIDIFTIREIMLIANGTFSPIEGFINSEDLKSVLYNMRLRTDEIWTVPISLRVEKDIADHLKEGEDILLVDEDNQEIAILHLEEIYNFKIDEYCKKLFGTNDKRHPGVFRLTDGRTFFLSGKISLLKSPTFKLNHYNHSPSQIRSVFAEKGWSKIVGFHTRNVIHRSHEFIQLKALEESGADGLFIHPVVGEKKKGDFKNEIIMQTYDLMVNKFYPKNKTFLAGFFGNSYYAGPKEAVFTAICRKNYGCSHFIIGRDHTGVYDFYGKYDSQDIFDKFPDIGIEIIKFKEVYFSKENGFYTTNSPSDELLNEDNYLNISGSEIRSLLKKNLLPDSNLMRKEIFNLIKKRKENLFV